MKKLGILKEIIEKTLCGIEEIDSDFAALEKELSKIGLAAISYDKIDKNLVLSWDNQAKRLFITNSFREAWMASKAPIVLKKEVHRHLDEFIDKIVEILSVRKVEVKK